MQKSLIITGSILGAAGLASAIAIPIVLNKKEDIRPKFYERYKSLLTSNWDKTLQTLSGEQGMTGELFEDTVLIAGFGGKVSKITFDGKTETAAPDVFGGERVIGSLKVDDDHALLVGHSGKGVLVDKAGKPAEGWTSDGKDILGEGTGLAWDAIHGYNDEIIVYGAGKRFKGEAQAIKKDGTLVANKSITESPKIIKAMHKDYTNQGFFVAEGDVLKHYDRNLKNPETIDTSALDSDPFEIRDIFENGNDLYITTTTGQIAHLTQDNKNIEGVFKLKFTGATGRTSIEDAESDGKGGYLVVGASVSAFDEVTHDWNHQYHGEIHHFHPDGTEYHSSIKKTGWIDKILKDGQGQFYTIGLPNSHDKVDYGNLEHIDFKGQITLSETKQETYARWDAFNIYK